MSRKSFGLGQEGGVDIPKLKHWVLTPKFDNDFVRDDEELYRRVRSESKFEEYFFDRGKLIINPAAFNDPYKKPSVDRAELKNLILLFLS